MAQKLLRWTHTLCRKKKKKPFSSRGENVAKELLSLAFLMNVTSEMPGGPSAVTDWGEAACHNRGIAPGVGEQRGDSQSRGKWYQTMQLWASSSCIQSFAFTHSSFRCRSAARSHPIQPKPPTSYSSVSWLNQLGNVLSFKLVEATNRVDLRPCFLRTPNRHPLCTLKTSSPVPLTYPAGCQDRLWLALATEVNCLRFLPSFLPSHPPTHSLTPWDVWWLSQHTDTSPGQRFGVNFCLLLWLAILSQLSSGPLICSTPASQQPSVNKTLAPDPVQRVT